MKNYISFFLHRPLLVKLMTFFMFIIGISALLVAKRDSYPEVDLGEVIIYTIYPGSSSEDVELKVTNKIEKELKKVTDIQKYNSFSLENLSMIKITLDPDNQKEYPRIKREIREAIERVNDFPDEVDERPTVIEVKSTVWPILEVGIRSDQMTYEELKGMAKVFERKLEKLQGVSHTQEFSLLDRQIDVVVDAKKLQRHQISLSQVVEALAARNVRSTAGQLGTNKTEREVVTRNEFLNPKDAEKVILRTSFSGPATTLRDVATIHSTHEDAENITRINGKNVISFRVFKAADGDIIRTIDRIKSFTNSQLGLMPKGTEILLSNDESDRVRTSFSIIKTNGSVGLILVVILISFFLPWRSALWVVFGIPFSLLGVVALIPFFGSHLDTITLSAMVIVLGVVVDDAIIFAENINRKFEEGLSPMQATIEGVHEVFWPVLTTVLTTLLAFIPMFFTSGTMGNFIFVIPLTICLALTISFWEGITILPSHIMHGLHKLKSKPSDKKVNWFDRIKRIHSILVTYTVKFRYLVILIFCAVLGFTLNYGQKTIKFDLFPSKNADRFFAFIELKSEATLEESSRISEITEKIIMQLPKEEFSSLITRAGLDISDDWTEINRPNVATHIVRLTPFGTRDRVVDDVIEDLRLNLSKVEGVEKVRFMVDSMGPPVGRPITLRAVGPDDTQRNALTDKIVELLQQEAGVRDIDRNDRQMKSQWRVQLDHDRLRRLGLTAAQVARTLRIAVDGLAVTSVRYGDEDVEYWVKVNHQGQSDQQYLLSLPIANQSGRLIYLSQVATLEETKERSNYYHFDGVRATTITADVDERVTAPVTVIQSILAKVDLNKNYPATELLVGGEVEETQKSMNSLFLVLLCALVAIYFLLVLLFNSMVQPVMVMLAIPFSLIGVILAFGLHHEPFSFLALLGVIGLVGVVVNDSLILVDRINQMRLSSPDRTIADIVIHGSVDRLRAIVLTTITTVAGLLPMAYGLGGKDAYMSPMALALGYGLLFSTPLTLLLLPCMYVIGDDIRYIIKRSILRSQNL